MIPDALVEHALRPWGRPLAGRIHDRTPERLVELWPSFPVPGPNSVSLVRCAPERVEALVAETRALAASRGLRCMWIVDPDTRPADLPERLRACGMKWEDELECMALPAAARLHATPGIEVVDALRDEDTYAAAEAVQEAAFGGGRAPGLTARFEEARAEPSRHCFLALVDGEPAGAGWATVDPNGVRLNGGAVAPRFQRQGVYRTLVAARLDFARQAGAPGVTTQARLDTSAPILAELGFTAVGRWHLFRDAAH